MKSSPSLSTFSNSHQPIILQEDDSLLIIDKPAGWIVNRAQTTIYQATIQDWLEERPPFSQIPPDSDSDFAKRLGIVHRLDKDTSGILLVAKTESAFLNLQHQFKIRQVKKTYLCLTHGRLTPTTGEIIAPIGRLPWNRRRFGVLPGGRPAITAYQVKSYWENSTHSGFSLISAFPRTGRTHQIRIHFKYLGVPLVADIFYAGRKISRQDRLWCPRQFLHAEKLQFFHPETGKQFTVTSPLPPDLNKALHTLSQTATID